MTIGILGGGLSGVALKHYLPDSLVLEKEPVPGGLCRSFSKDGFSYDLGGHILFSKDKTTLSEIILILGNNVKEHYRRNRIWFKKGFVRYPFENGLPDLPLSDRFSCFYHYLRRPRLQSKNFGEWIIKNFGEGFSDRYLTPYNKKIWKTPLDQIATTWVERVPNPPLFDLLKGVIGIKTEGYLHQLCFHYPKTGGIESLIKAFAKGAKGIRCNFEVKSVRKAGDSWVVSNGVEELEFERIISTLPMPDFLPVLEGVPSQIIEAAKKLRFNSLIIVMIGIKSQNPPSHFAVYFPQPHLIFHRVCFPAYLGSHYAPAEMSSMVAEITVPAGDPFYQLPDRDITDKVIEGLACENFLRPCDIITTDVARVRYAYVIDTRERMEIMNEIKRFLEGQGIIVCGRFAEFEYLNMDAVVARAKKLAYSVI